MSDIVERLHKVVTGTYEGCAWDIAAQAADEIERLRTRQSCEGDQPYICHALATARSDNERLRQRVEFLMGIVDVRENETARLREENRELAGAAYAANELCRARDAAWAECDALREKVANWEYSAKYDDVHVAALRKDAERYRWLRDESHKHLAWGAKHGIVRIGDGLDSAIDAAMGERP